MKVHKVWFPHILVIIVVLCSIYSNIAIALLSKTVGTNNMIFSIEYWFITWLIFSVDFPCILRNSWIGLRPVLIPAQSRNCLTDLSFIGELNLGSFDGVVVRSGELIGFFIIPILITLLMMFRGWMLILNRILIFSKIHGR